MEFKKQLLQTKWQHWIPVLSVLVYRWSISKYMINDTDNLNNVELGNRFLVVGVYLFYHTLWSYLILFILIKILS